MAQVPGARTIQALSWALLGWSRGWRGGWRGGRGWWAVWAAAAALMVVAVWAAMWLHRRRRERFGKGAASSSGDDDPGPGPASGSGSGGKGGGLGGGKNGGLGSSLDGGMGGSTGGGAVDLAPRYRTLSGPKVRPKNSRKAQHLSRPDDGTSPFPLHGLKDGSTYPLELPAKEVRAKASTHNIEFIGRHYISYQGPLPTWESMGVAAVDPSQFECKGDTCVTNFEVAVAKDPEARGGKGNSVLRLVARLYQNNADGTKREFLISNDHTSFNRNKEYLGNLVINNRLCGLLSEGRGNSFPAQGLPGTPLCELPIRYEWTTKPVTAQTPLHTLPPAAPTTEASA